MIEIKLSDFSLKSSISSHYAKENNKTRQNFNYDEFLDWVKVNYDLTDSKNYILYHHDSLKSWISKESTLNVFGNKMVSFVKESTGIDINDSSSLMGLSISIKYNDSLLKTGSTGYSIHDLHKDCTLLAKCGIINKELSNVLDILNKKLGIFLVTEKDKKHFMICIRDAA